MAACVKILSLSCFLVTLYIFGFSKGENVEASDCADTKGQVQPNGTTWHPEVHGKENKCVICTCLVGDIKCERIKCPAVNLSCKKPRKRKGQCCPTCPKRGKRKRSKGKGKLRCRKNKKRRQGKKNKKDDKNKKRRRRKDRRRKNRKSNKCINGTISALPGGDNTCPAILKSTQKLPCFFKNLCLPERTDYIVYRQFIYNHTAFIAFDHVASNQIEIWTYNISKDKITGRQKYKPCHSDTFRNQISNVKTILGAGTKRSVRDFKRKVERGLKGCEQKPKGCRLRTIRRHLLCFELSKIDTPKNDNCR